MLRALCTVNLCTVLGVMQRLASEPLQSSTLYQKRPHCVALCLGTVALKSDWLVRQTEVTESYLKTFIIQLSERISVFKNRHLYHIRRFLLFLSRMSFEIQVCVCSIVSRHHRCLYEVPNTIWKIRQSHTKKFPPFNFSLIKCQVWFLLNTILNSR